MEVMAAVFWEAVIQPKDRSCIMHIRCSSCGASFQIIRRDVFRTDQPDHVVTTSDSLNFDAGLAVPGRPLSSLAAKLHPASGQMSDMA